MEIRVEGKVEKIRIVEEKQKKAEEKQKKEFFEINTGAIFSALKDQWRKFDRQFLIDLEDHFISMLNFKKKVTNRYKESEKDYFINHVEYRYDSDLREVKNPEHFPFPSYYLKNIDSDPYPSIISFDKSCVVEKDEFDFDLFFALKATLTDVMEMKQFLDYHVENTFENDEDRFKEYLDAICLKFKKITDDQFTPIIGRYFAKREEPQEEKPIVQNEKSKEYTTSRQVMAIYYLLDELNAYKGVNKSEIAKFVMFLTGKETGVKNINDTTIYKKVCKPLSGNEVASDLDLSYIRPFFEKLELMNIVSIINKELGQSK